MELLMSGAKTLGDVGSSFLNYGAKKAQAREARKALTRSQNHLEEGFDKVQGLYEPQLATSEKDEAMFRNQILSGEYNLPDMGNFKYEGDISKFLDPAMDFEIDQGNRALTASAFGRGVGKSGNTMRALQDHGMNVARTGYGDAYNRMTEDKTFTYNDYLNKYKNMVEQIRERKGNMSHLATQATGNRNNMANLFGNQSQSRADNALAKGQVNIQGNTAGWQLGNDLLNTGGKAFGNIMGGMNFNNQASAPVPPPNFDMGLSYNPFKGQVQ